MPSHLPGPPPADLPDDLRELAEGRSWTGVATWSPSEVWRLDPPGVDPGGPSTVGRTTFLKVIQANGPEVAEHEREVALLDWLGDGLAPTIAGHGVLADGRPWLVTWALAGADGRDPSHHFAPVESLLAGLGRVAAAVHAHPVDGCPVAATVEDALDRAERRVAAGLVDPGDFAPAFRRYSAAQLLAHVVAMAPPEPDRPVLTHGDLSVANAIVLPGQGRASGLVDWGRGGVGDPARDLALLVRSVARHIGPEASVQVVEAYDGPRPDPARLDFWALLDELQ